MKAHKVLQIGIITVGVLLGAYFSNLSYSLHEKDTHTELSSHSNMTHGIIDVTNDSIIPQIVKLEILKDSVAGWNLYIQINNFKFTPENVNKEHRQGEGHAHLFINGNKIARLYTNRFYISELLKDKNQIEVTVNANSHAVMMVNNRLISKKIMLSNGITK